MNKLLIITKTEGRVATNIANFRTKTAMETAIKNLDAFNRGPCPSTMLVRYVILVEDKS